MRSKQSTSHIMMIRPKAFGYNEETAANNSYQQAPDGTSPSEISEKAIEEFDAFADQLKRAGVDLIVIEDTEKPVKPDAVFPNNWISFHDENVLITYPMFSPKRREERREEIIEALDQSFVIDRRYAFEFGEEKDHFLEGTGSMVLDRMNKIVYACLSPRTNIKMLDRFCLLMGYSKVVFHAVDESGEPIYHTNVVMALGTEFAVICLEAIPDADEQKKVREQLERTGKTVIDINYQQLNDFAGNMLEVKTDTGDTLIVMSDTAYHSLDPDQLKALSNFGSIIHPAIPTIEKYGGGSVRCMMAEVFLDECNSGEAE